MTKERTEVRTGTTTPQGPQPHNPTERGTCDSIIRNVRMTAFSCLTGPPPVRRVSVSRAGSFILKGVWNRVFRVEQSTHSDTGIRMRINLRRRSAQTDEQAPGAGLRARAGQQRSCHFARDSPVPVRYSTGSWALVGCHHGRLLCRVAARIGRSARAGAARRDPIGACIGAFRRLGCGGLAQPE